MKQESVKFFSRIDVLRMQARLSAEIGSGFFYWLGVQQSVSFKDKTLLAITGFKIN